jgi:N-acetylmuramoyl-L-alanine amidase
MRWIDGRWIDGTDRMPGRTCNPRLHSSASAGPVHSAFICKRAIRLSVVLAALFVSTGFLLAAQAPPAPAAQAPPAPANRFVVVLDAAHGGDDLGAGLGGQPEKAYTLALSVRLRSLLMARGFTVVTTRESDATVDADHRAEIANHAGAQACLSLHATESGSGAHLFVSSLAPA